MGGRAKVVAAIAGILLAGCSLDRVGIAAMVRDGGAEPRDAGRDAGSGRDAQVREDGGIVATCEPRCEADRAIRCEAGVEVVNDCAADDAVCVSDAAGPACQARLCEPDAARCEGDLLLTCDALGAAEMESECEHGCQAGACLPAPSCPWDGELAEIVDEGMYAVDLCGRSDDHGVLDGSCEGASGNGEDTLVRLVVTQRARLRLDLRDVDGPAAVDTVLSLRRACDVVESQVMCADDVPCDDSDEDLRNTTCESGRQPRQSRATLELDTGTYYLVLDADVRDSFRCGRVELRVRRMPMGGDD